MGEQTAQASYMQYPTRLQLREYIHLTYVELNRAVGHGVFIVVVEGHKVLRTALHATGIEAELAVIAGGRQARRNLYIVLVLVVRHNISGRET